MGIPMLKIRRSWDRLIFNMEIPILVRHLYTETAPWWMHKEFATPAHTLVLMNPYPVGVTDEPTWGAPVVSRQEPPAEYHLTTGSPTECCFMSFLPGMVSVFSMIHHNIILTHGGWNKMVDVLQVSFSIAFIYWNRNFWISSKFYRNMFCRILWTLCQRWFR